MAHHYLELYRVRLTQWYKQRVPVHTMRQKLMEEYNVRVALRTLFSHLRGWGLQRFVCTCDTGFLRERIAALCTGGNKGKKLQPHEMLEILQKEGFIITDAGLLALRRKLGFTKTFAPTVADRIGSEPYKSRFLQWAEQGLSLNRMVRNLRVEYKLNTRPLVVQKRLEEWRVEAGSPCSTNDSDDLRRQIASLFLQGHSDQKMLEILRAAQYRVTPYGLLRIRTQMGYVRYLSSWMRTRDSVAVGRSHTGRVIYQLLPPQTTGKESTGQQFPAFKADGSPLVSYFRPGVTGEKIAGQLRAKDRFRVDPAAIGKPLVGRGLRTNIVAEDTFRRQSREVTRHHHSTAEAKNNPEALQNESDGSSVSHALPGDKPIARSGDVLGNAKRLPGMLSPKVFGTIYSPRADRDIFKAQKRSFLTFGYTQSKALVYSRHGEPADVLSLHKYSISPAYSDNLTIRFLASPINPADVNQIQGTYPSKPNFSTALGTPQPSAVGGNEGVAEVIATGSNVKSLQKGDWVLMKRPAFGTWRTCASVASEAGVVKIEDRQGISAIQAGTVSVNPCTAYRMLRDIVRLDPEDGDWFIQNGANSGVGRAAIQLGRLWGYKSINVVRDRPELEALKQELHQLGADVVVTEDELADARTFSERAKEWTQGGRQKIRLGLNCVGGRSATDMAKTLAEDAHLVTYGAMSRRPFPVPAGMLIFKNIHFDGFWVSRWSERHPDEKKQTVEEILGLMRAGRFKDVPVREIRWGDGGAASEEVLKEVVQGTLDGFREKKGVFVFEG
ncbi:MAG: mitochondrial 2-enoyl thioester reductase [Phylliscum demangeonii]|nr:MAG: mitochondrial 2-enoyl thioester reductase [Phylliscum demangeonii]